MNARPTRARYSQCRPRPQGPPPRRRAAAETRRPTELRNNELRHQPRQHAPPSPRHRAPRRPAMSRGSPRRPAHASRARVFWLLSGTFFVCGLSTNGLVQTHFIPLCHDFGMPAVEAAPSLPSWGCSTSSAPWARAGCPTVSTIAGCCSGPLPAGASASSCCRFPASPSTACLRRVFRPGFHRHRPAHDPPHRPGIRPRAGKRCVRLDFAAHQLGGAAAAWTSGASRDALASYLPAFFAAGSPASSRPSPPLATSRRPAGEVKKRRSLPWP